MELLEKKIQETIEIANQKLGKLILIGKAFDDDEENKELRHVYLEIGKNKPLFYLYIATNNSGTTASAVLITNDENEIKEWCLKNIISTYWHSNRKWVKVKK